MEERSTGLTPEKTDQSNTDDPPQEPEGLCAFWMDDFEPELARLADPHQDPDEDIREKERALSRILTSLSKSILEEFKDEFETKWISRSVRYSQDFQVSLLSEEMFNLEIEAMVFLGMRNFNKYLMDKNLGEIIEEFGILTEYVSRISQGRSAYCCKIRQLLNDHKRLRSLIGRVCQEYRNPTGICLILNETNMSQLQQSFNYKPGDDVNADPPELSCSPEPKGKTMEVPSCHNSYEDNLEKEWNSPDLCHSNDSSLTIIHLKGMIDYDKRHTQEIQKKLKDLTERVHKIPSSSGCNNPQPELLQRLERLNSLIAEDINSYGEDHSMANDDDHNQASPTSSTTDTDQFTHQLGDKEMQDKKTKEHHEPQMVKNEAEKCSHSCSHQHVIHIRPKNEAVEDDREMSDRRNAITELSSRVKHYFVSQNIGEELPFCALLVALLAALGNPRDLRSQETSPPLSLNEAFFMLRGLIAWSAMFFLISICTAIRVVGSRCRVLAVSFLGLSVTYYFIALASTTTGSSVLFGSVTMSSFWFVLGGAALVFVLVILLVIGLLAFLF